MNLRVLCRLPGGSSSAGNLLPSSCTPVNALHAPTDQRGNARIQRLTAWNLPTTEQILEVLGRLFGVPPLVKCPVPASGHSGARPPDRFVRLLPLAALLLAGCLQSSPPPANSNTATSTAATTTESGKAGGTDSATTGTTGPSGAAASGTGTGPFAGLKMDPDYPDVPIVEIMSELDGVQIPRMPLASAAALDPTIGVDVGNPRANAPSTPTTGDTIRVRMESEPKVLNPIIESSAVQTYMMQNVSEGLLRQDPETFEWTPWVAKSWTTADSVKLAANYPGHERSIGVIDSEQRGPTASFHYDMPALKDDGSPVSPPPLLKLTTHDGAGKPIGNTWVGLKAAGAATVQFHLWSNSEGVLEVSNIPTGDYEALVGDEVLGKSELKDDGTLVLTPADGTAALTLKADEYQDRQLETLWTFDLRDDVKWSDGAPYTARDVVFAFQTVQNPSVDGDHLRVYYTDVISVDAIGDYQVRMKLRQQYFKAIEFCASLSIYGPPFHFFEQNLLKSDDPTAQENGIAGRQLTQERLTDAQEDERKQVSVHGPRFARYFNNSSTYNRAPLGTGPYRVVRWDRGEQLVLERNPYYWNKERPGYVDKMVFRFIVDNVTAFQALKAGEVDFCPRLTAEQFHDDLAGPPDWFAGTFVKASWYTPAYGYVGYNMLKDAFKDRRVRVALSLLFDKQQFLEKKLYGDAVIISGSQYYFGPGYDHSVPALQYDPDTARELLAEAGWSDTNGDGVLDRDGKPFEIKIYIVPGNRIVQERIELFQKSLKSVGITLNVELLEWAAFIDKIRRREDFDICTLSWAMPTESDPFQIWHSSEAGPTRRGSNHVSFANPVADRLIEMIRVTLDDKKRQRINHALHRVLDAEQPYMFLYCPKDFAAYHQRFRGVKWYRVRPGYDLTEWYVPRDEQSQPSAATAATAAPAAAGPTGGSGGGGTSLSGK